MSCPEASGTSLRGSPVVFATCIFTNHTSIDALLTSASAKNTASKVQHPALSSHRVPLVFFVRQSVTVTLTSDPVALGLYHEWSLEEVKAVLREVFCLESRTQVGLQRRVARCRTSCSRSLPPPPFCACRRKLVSRVRGCL